MAKKILIVEDNVKNMVFLSDVLRFHGYAVIEAKDGEEGVNLAREEKPDLIFMDLQMPLMDGYAAVRLLKAAPETKNLKVIAITAFAMEGDKEKAKEAGFDEYIAKPIKIDELLVLVKNYLGG